MIEFKLNTTDSISLCDLLKTTGLCQNGGHAKAVIADGLVTVNGEVETRKRYKAQPNDVIEFESQKITVLP